MSKEDLKIPFDAQLDIVKTYEEEDKLYIEGYAATTDYDDQGDVITPEAIKQSENDLLERSTVLLNHDKDRPIGKVETAAGDTKGLKIKVLISKAEPEVRQKVKEGVLNKFSIRGAILESTKEKIKHSGKEIWANIIKAMKLIEVSLVSIPANSQAKTLAWYMSKALEEKVYSAEEVEALKKEIRELKGYSVGSNIPSTYMMAYARHMKGLTDRKIKDGVNIKAKGYIKAIYADEDDYSCSIEIEEGEILEVTKSMSDIKKKDGVLYTQEEVDAMEVKLQNTEKELADIKLAVEAKEIESKKLQDESKKSIDDMNVKSENISKELISVKTELETVKKERDDIKAKQADEAVDKQVASKWMELEGKSYKKEDADAIKAILKKGLVGQALTPEETDALISKQIKGSVLKLGFETVGTGEMTKERRNALIAMGGLKIKSK